MVASSVNYVVVEKISWKHDNSTVAGGKALADLVLADGTKVAGATIASVNNAVTTNYNSGVVEVLTAKVADDYTNNNAYYNRIFTYSVNADGSYDLVKYCDATNVNRPQHWRSYHYQGQDRYHCWLHQHGCCQH